MNGWNLAQSFDHGVKNHSKGRWKGNGKLRHYKSVTLPKELYGVVCVDFFLKRELKK